MAYNKLKYDWMKHILFLLISIVLTNSLFAQEKRIELAQTGLFPSGYNNNAQVFINENAKLQSIINNHKIQNKNKQEIRGWRIRVYMGSGRNARDEANTIKLKIRNRYTEVEPHLVHHSPYFKILVGDFRTRIEAESFQKKLKREYPNCYVVESEVRIDNL